jgi:glycosyltransferase involved in cell wall biosynthesis
VARESGAILWILGPAEDGFDEELRQLLAELGALGRHLAPPGVTIDDAYAACDAVAVTSTWEGFGNPVIEAFVHELPLVLFPYPVARELLAFGFKTFSPDDSPGLIQEFRQPNLERRQHNHEIVRRHFNLADLPEKLSTILATCGTSSR